MLDGFLKLVMSRGNKATLIDSEDNQTWTIDTRDVQRLARVTLAGRAWPVPELVPDSHDTIENTLELIPELVPTRVVLADTEEENTDTAPGTDDRWIRTLLDAGHSKNEVAKIIGGNRSKALARIRKALE